MEVLGFDFIFCDYFCMQTIIIATQMDFSPDEEAYDKSFTILNYKNYDFMATLLQNSRTWELWIQRFYKWWVTIIHKMHERWLLFFFGKKFFSFLSLWLLGKDISFDAVSVQCDPFQRH